MAEAQPPAKRADEEEFVMMEFDDRAHDIEDELQQVRGALLDDTIATLAPAEPICLPPTATVEDAIARMLERRQACVLVVDAEGRLTGILTERDGLAYAVHCMSVAGFRTVPLVDTERRPIGIVTVSDVIHWLAQLFPEAVLNLPPGDTLKRPHEMDAG